MIPGGSVIISEPEIGAFLSSPLLRAGAVSTEKLEAAVTRNLQQLAWSDRQVGSDKWSLWKNKSPGEGRGSRGLGGEPRRGGSVRARAGEGAVRSGCRRRGRGRGSQGTAGPLTKRRRPRATPGPRRGEARPAPAPPPAGGATPRPRVRARPRATRLGVREAAAEAGPGGRQKMARVCRRQQCSVERRGFRQELDSWRHKLIRRVGETVAPHFSSGRC
ncbi:uncharacterized protein RHO17_017730 [Thomomys bottae]